MCLYYLLYKDIEFTANCVFKKLVSITCMCHSFSPITCFSFSLFEVYYLFTFRLFFLGVPSLKPILFLFSPSHCSPPPSPLSPTHRQAACQSKAQKKLQPLTQVPILQEQGEYCAGLGGVWTWVPAVWSRGGGGVLFFFFPFHASVLSFNFHLSAHLQG